jgi:hypothetical protein
VTPFSVTGEPDEPAFLVIPANAGIQPASVRDTESELDSRLRGNDGGGAYARRSSKFIRAAAIGLARSCCHAWDSTLATRLPSRVIVAAA